jgi:hypothetical protein
MKINRRTWMKAAAYRWIEKGTIAELQESLTNLQVCFTTENLIRYTPF